jgi:diacylglycerol O-acyltransferase / wax synthase
MKRAEPGLNCMRQLSGLDATFLYLETPQMPMHVGALHLFELPAGFPASFVTALRQHLAGSGCPSPGAAPAPVVDAAEHGQPGLGRRRARPAQHIVEVKLPGGAGLASWRPRWRAAPRCCSTASGRCGSSMCSRAWRRAGGPARVALYTQLHHAAVDGQAAVALANAILDVTPQPRAIELRRRAGSAPSSSR